MSNKKIIQNFKERWCDKEILSHYYPLYPSHLVNSSAGFIKLIYYSKKQNSE